jgi:hypothetical protein
MIEVGIWQGRSHFRQAIPMGYWDDRTWVDVWMDGSITGAGLDSSISTLRKRTFTDSDQGGVPLKSAGGEGQ